MLNLPIAVCFCADLTYVALAETILPDELRPYASAAGLCHFHVTFSGEKKSLIRVAALPHRLDDGATSRHVFTIWVNTEQLDSALSWDRALQNLPTCEVREQLEARLSPCFSSFREEILPTTCNEELTSTGETVAQRHEEVTLVPLPELFVSVETVNEAAHEQSGASPTLPTHPTRWTRFIWLRAALAMVRRQAQHTHCVFDRLDILLNKVISMQHRVRSSLVSASPVHIGNRLVGWKLQIAFPLLEVLA